VKPTLSASKITAQSVTELNVPAYRGKSGRKPISASHTPRSMVLCDKITNAETGSVLKSSEFLS